MAQRFTTRTARRPNHVRAWRKRAGLTIEQLAEKIGAAPSTVSKIENLQQDFNAGHQEAIAEALDCTPFDLLFVDPASGQSGEFEGYWDAFTSLTTDSKRQIIELMRVLPKAGKRP